MKRWACTDQTNFGNEYNELNIHKCQWQLFSFFFLTKQNEYQSYLHLNGRNRFRNTSGTYLKASTLKMRLVSDCLPCEWNFPQKKSYQSRRIHLFWSIEWTKKKKRLTFIQKYLEIKNTNEISKIRLLVANGNDGVSTHVAFTPCEEIYIFFFFWFQTWLINECFIFE